MNLIARDHGLRLGYHQAHQIIWIPFKEKSFWIQARQFIAHVIKKDPLFQGLILINFQLTQSFITVDEIKAKHPKNKKPSGTIELQLYVAGEKRSLFADLYILEERLHFLFNEYVNKYLQSKNPFETLSQINYKLNVKFRFLSSPYLHPQWIFYKLHKELHKGLNIRRVLSLLSLNVLKSGARGIKIQIKGRINGVEKATILVEEKGKMPRQNLNADIDYFFSPLKTVYGLLGIKIWVFRGFLKN